MATKGIKQTKEHIEKRTASFIMGGKLKGRTPWNKGARGLQKAWNKGAKGLQVPWNKGIKYPQISGENHHNWKGGVNPVNDSIRKSIEFRLWRESVFARDNWTCQKCKARGDSINAHHICNFARYPELRFAIDNGVTLCKECHTKFHKKYGKKDNNLNQLFDFIKSLTASS
jgi:hypothetical protein